MGPGAAAGVYPVQDVPARRRDAAGSLATIVAYRRMTTDHRWLGRAWLGFGAGLVALVGGLLLGPRVLEVDQGQHCVGNVHLPGPFAIALDCDSPQFTWLARQPRGLLEPGNARQSRPGLVVAAALLTRPLALVFPPGGPPLPAPHHVTETERITSSLARDLPAYLAYIALNCGILLLCFALLRELMAPAGPEDGTQTVLLVAVGLLLIGNDITKAFFWSPHTQLFNVLVPVLAIYGSLRVLDGAAFERAFALGMGLAVGLGVTAYEFFAVIPVCLVPPFLWAIARDPARARSALANLALLVLLSCAPMALWYACVVHRLGHFYQTEQMGPHPYARVAWILEALRHGTFLSQFLDQLGQLLARARPQAVAAAMLGGLLGFAAIGDRAAAAALRARLPAVLTGLYVSAAMLAFYTGVGWVLDRLAYPAIPPLLVAGGMAAAAMARRMGGRGRRRLALGCLGVALVNLVWVVAKDGPWS